MWPQGVTGSEEGALEAVCVGELPLWWRWGRSSCVGRFVTDNCKEMADSSTHPLLMLFTDVLGPTHVWWEHKQVTKATYTAGTNTLHTGIHCTNYMIFHSFNHFTITCSSCHLPIDLLNKILIFWIQSSFNFTTSTSVIFPICAVLVCLHQCRTPWETS